MRKVVAGLLLLLLLPIAGQAEDFAYTTSADNTITITGYTGSGGDVTIPGTINGLPVTIIGNEAFADCKSITSITIPDSVTSIGEFAFYGCTSLTGITIGNGVTSIGGEAFYGCISLNGITIPNCVTNIETFAFFRCTRLSTISVDELNAVYSSTNGVLFNKSQTTLIQYPTGKSGSYTIPCSVTNIEPYAFYCRTSLTSVTIPDSVTSIGDWAFSGCDSLTGITIGNGVTSIGESAFYSCFNLTSITIPDSVTSIGESAFYSCFNLTSITIPDSVTSIGSYAFRNCYGLAGVIIGNGITSIGYKAFIFCNSLTNITIPDSVTSIGDGAFYGCLSLIGITIGNGVTNIGYEAFGSCDSLTSVTIPGSVTSIRDGAFQCCTSLTSVTIGNGVTSIGDEAFYGCISLNNVTIPASVTSIGYGALVYCTSLTKVYCSGNAPVVGGSVFDGASSATVYRFSQAIGWPTVPDPWAGRPGCPTALWLIVNGGTDGGSYTNLQAVTIIANPPAAGKTFDRWTGDTQFVASATSSTTTVAVPAQAITLSATYIDVEQYTANGTPYSWLAGHGLTNSDATFDQAAVADQDGDGLKTWQEYIAGTNPTNRTSCFKVTQAARNTVSWSPVSGRVYSVYWTTNLMSGFQCLESSIPWTRSSFTNPTAAPRSFYKIDVRLE